MKYLAATVQFEPEMFAKERNIDALVRLVEEAAASGARLIITPEMGLTGYCWYDREEVAPYVEQVPGPSTQSFAALAAKLDCYIVIGLPEVDADNGLYYNTAVLVGPEGYLGKHRKSHPYIAEPKWAASGDTGHQVFETSLGRIALLICMDIHFLETARLVALQGAEVICHLSNWLAERAPAPYWISRAKENGCYLIESNRWGVERGVQFSGGSCVIEPDGHIQASRDDGDGNPDGAFVSQCFGSRFSVVFIRVSKKCSGLFIRRFTAHCSLLKECPEQADQHEHEQHGEGEETVARHAPLVTQRP